MTEKLTIPAATKKAATKKRGRQPRSEETRASRRKRQPFGSLSLKLSVDQATLDKLEKNDMVPRWINDDNHGSRIKEALAGDYEFVEAEGTEVIGTESADADRKVKKLVGTHNDGSPKYSYLMAIKREYYEEDQQAKENTNLMVDESIRAGKPNGTQSLNISSDKARVSADVKYKP